MQDEKLGKKFRKLTSQTEVRALLQKASDQQARCTFWIHPDPDPRRGKIQEFLASKEILVIDGLETKAEATEALVSLFLKNAAVLCFRGETVQLSDSLMGVKPGREVYEIQRRHELRIPISSGYELNLEWMDPIVKAKIRVRLSDLSTHGISFLVKKDVLERFEPDSKIDRVLLFLRQKRVVFSMKVENQTPVNPKDEETLWRIGASITRMNEEDTQTLSDYVSEQAVLNFLPGVSAKVQSR